MMQPMPMPAPVKLPVEDPSWWRYGAFPFIVLILAAATADFGMYCDQLGIGAGLACILLTSAILLLRKDYTRGERWFLGILAVVNGAALAVSGSWVNYALGFTIPFILQIFPLKSPINTPCRFRTWWEYWVAHRKHDDAGKGRCRWRSIMPTFLSILVGAILFIAFLAIFAHGNPVVQQVWTAIADAWNKVVTYLNLGRDFLIHLLFWCIGIVFFGFFALRRPNPLPVLAPAKADDDAPGKTVLPYLPICSLIGVNLAFLITTSTDIAYLWFRNVPEGISQTVYLHDGAASITWASALAAIMLVFFFRRKGSARHSAACKISGYLLVVQTFLLAVSVYMRLYYQISDGGFTVLRIRAAEAMLLGLAGLVVLLFYMAGSGSFCKYVKIALCTAMLMLVSFSICSPSRIAGDLNMRYIATHPQWQFNELDFQCGRFKVEENLTFAYYIYKQNPTGNSRMNDELLTTAENVISKADEYKDSQAGSWRNWIWVVDADYETACDINKTLSYSWQTREEEEQTTEQPENDSNN